MSSTPDLQIYSASTPNGQRVHVLLEELGVQYQANTINIRVGEQFSNDFRKIAAQNRIPAVVDNSVQPALRFCESGAISIYLARKYGKGKLLPAEPEKEAQVLQWVFFAASSLAPMLGQLGFFSSREEKTAYAIERYTNESTRILLVLDQQLARSEGFLVGSELTIADTMAWPWVYACLNRDILKDRKSEFPHLFKWAETLAERPAFKKGLEVCKIDQLSDPKAFGTFQRTSDADFNIYDVASHLEVIRKNPLPKE